MEFKEITELVGKAKNGDQSAIAQLYEATSKAVYFTALKIVGNPSDAEDIAQDTYVTAISKLSELKDDATFPKWIKTIAANTAKNYMTKKKPMLFNTDEDEQAALGSIPEVSDEFIPDAAADRKETCRLVSEMIDTLPEKQRTALIMFYYDEMTISEIAEAMGTNDNTIKSRLNYARKYIKDEVEALAKKGTKLYGVAGMPLIAFVLRNLAADTAVPAGIASKVTVATATAVATTTTAAVATTTTTTAATTVATTATGFAFGTAAKVAIAAVVSVAVIGGGVAVANVVSEPNVFEAEVGTPSEFELMLEDYLFGEGELDTKYFDDVEELYIYGNTVTANRCVFDRFGYNSDEYCLTLLDYGWSFSTWEEIEAEDGGWQEIPICSYGNVSDISFLEGMSNITYLSITHNNISDIFPLSELKKLECIEFIYNDISDISLLKELRELKYLYLDSNKISDVSSLKNLKELEYLSICDNNISKEDVLSLKEALPNCEIYSDYNFEYEEVIVGKESVINTENDYTYEYEPYVYLSGVEAEAAAEMIKNYLNGTGEMDYEMLRGIHSLEIIGGDYVVVNYNKHSLFYDDMKYNDSTKELDYFYVNANTELPVTRLKINDISFISKMNLLSLEINYCDIDDYNSILKCTEITDLSLNYCNIPSSFVEEISQNNKITELSLEGSGLTDISCFANAKSLQVLSLSDNEISDITALTELLNLKEVNLTGNNISRVYSLEKLVNLENLVLFDNEISDISSLSNLTSLKNLVLAGNKITDISAIAGLMNLETLHIFNNQISDMSPLYGLEKLSIAQIYSNNITENDVALLKEALPNCFVEMRYF